MLKAIINRTRSIDNEFLVINIKAEPCGARAVGYARCRVVLGASRLQDKINNHKQPENPDYDPVTQSRNGNENWTNNNNNNIEVEVEKRIAAGLYFWVYLFIRWPEGRHVVAAAAIVVDRGKRKQKNTGSISHPLGGMVQDGMRPWICGDRERLWKCARFKLNFHARKSTTTW